MACLPRLGYWAIEPSFGISAAWKRCYCSPRCVPSVVCGSCR